MKRYLMMGMLILSCILLVSCSFRGNPYPSTDMTNERWQRLVETDTNKWTWGADRWFMTGDPNSQEEMSRQAPYSAAISTMMVRVPDFRNIKVSGAFQVQIFGALDHNSVYVFGPNDAVRDTVVQVRNGMLFLSQTKKPSRNIGQVIIRIGVVNLNRLVQEGPGTVEGRQLRSSGLSVVSAGMGNMYLAGNINLMRVESFGAGNVSIFGAETPVLDILAYGSGSVNVSGNLGVRRIVHHGAANINIIGANSNALTIYADGRGKIGINGIFNVCEITAKDNVCIYGYNVTGNKLNAYVMDQAHVGLAGRTELLYARTTRAAKFEGRYLCTQTAYVKADDNTHINVSANGRIFASATGNSSVYYFGSPNVLTQFISSNGTIIPISGILNGCTVCEAPAPAHPSYKGEVESYTYKREIGKPYHHKTKKAKKYKPYIYR